MSNYLAECAAMRSRSTSSEPEKQPELSIAVIGSDHRARSLGALRADAWFCRHCRGQRPRHLAAGHSPPYRMTRPRVRPGCGCRSRKRPLLLLPAGAAAFKRKELRAMGPGGQATGSPPMRFGLHPSKTETAGCLDPLARVACKSRLDPARHDGRRCGPDRP